MTLHFWRNKYRAAMTVFAAMLTLVAAGCHAAGTGMHTALPEPSDLSVDAAQAKLRGVPVVILFSFPGCAYCDVVRQNYLAPLLRDVPEQRRPVIREVQISSAASFAGFNREQITQRALAQRYGVRFAPTVVLLDGAGNLLTSPIVGGDTAGLYGGYLDNAFGEAARKLAGRRQLETSGE